MGRYVDLAKEIEADVSCREPAYELNELNELRVGTEPVQSERGDAARWGNATAAVEWFLGSEPPTETFVMVWNDLGTRPAVTITDCAAYWKDLRIDLAIGRGLGRDHVGAVVADRAFQDRRRRAGAVEHTDKLAEEQSAQ